MMKNLKINKKVMDLIFSGIVIIMTKMALHLIEERILIDKMQLKYSIAISFVSIYSE